MPNSRGVLTDVHDVTEVTDVPSRTVDVVYTWKYGGPHILNSICANEMKPHVYNAYVL